ncbi:hypothetical protein FRC08_009175 [Ceratobasidium sp. 394]|nr:hypothetical protein FRC08_009175 [Ceratobasidium sp. 394]
MRRRLAVQLLPEVLYRVLLRRRIRPPRGTSPTAKRRRGRNSRPTAPGRTNTARDPGKGLHPTTAQPGTSTKPRPARSHNGAVTDAAITRAANVAAAVAARPTAQGDLNAAAALGATAAPTAIATTAGIAPHATTVAAATAPAVRVIVAVRHTTTVSAPAAQSADRHAGDRTAHADVLVSGDALVPRDRTAGGRDPSLQPGRAPPTPVIPDIPAAPRAAATTFTAPSPTLDHNPILNVSKNRHRPDLAAGVLAPPDDAMIPAPVRKVFDKGLRTHVPFTNLTDAHCQSEFLIMRHEEHTTCQPMTRTKCGCRSSNGYKRSSAS